MSPWSVICPKCGALPGRPCIGARKVPQERKTPHAQRIARAAALKGRPSRHNGEWAILRAQVFAAKGAECVYCGKPASHVDHLTPQSRGGGDNIDNLVPCCAACNIAKGTMTAAEFKR